MIFRKQLQIQKELLEKKEVAFYSAVVAGWFNTRMERDKSLLTLSATGVGLLITLLKNFGAASVETRLTYIGAILSFCTCIIAVLCIFKRNATHLEEIIHSNATNDPLLEKLDFIALYSFGIGIIFSSAIGISSAFSQEPKHAALNQAEEVKMADQQESQTGKTVGTAMAKDSLAGVSSLRPSSELKSLNGSVNGANKLNLSSPQSTANPYRATSSQKTPVTQKSSGE